MRLLCLGFCTPIFWFVLLWHVLSYFCPFRLALSIRLPAVAFAVAIASSDPISESTSVVLATIPETGTAADIHFCVVRKIATLRKRDGEMENTALALCSPTMDDPATEAMQVEGFDNLDSTQVASLTGRGGKGMSREGYASHLC